jgi:hypothetical protein
VLFSGKNGIKNLGEGEVKKMKRNPSEMHWMHRGHMPHVHAIHLHPAHWLGEHPLLLALLISSIIALCVAGLIYLQSNGSLRFDLPERNLSYPMMYSFGTVY